MIPNTKKMKFNFQKKGDHCEKYSVTYTAYGTTVLYHSVCTQLYIFSFHFHAL